MYEALDSLNMMPVTDATPLSTVFPRADEANQPQEQTDSNLNSTAEILIHMNQGNPTEQPMENTGKEPSDNEARLPSQDSNIENPLTAMVLYSNMVSLCIFFTLYRFSNNDDNNCYYHAIQGQTQQTTTVVSPADNELVPPGLISEANNDTADASVSAQIPQEDLGTAIRETTLRQEQTNQEDKSKVLLMKPNTGFCCLFDLSSLASIAGGTNRNERTQECNS